MPVLDPDLTVDRLTRDFTILQRKRGHRHSTDDLLTAWYAAESASSPRKILDLGSGIGSVGLAVLWRFPKARLTAVEAQDVSFGLLRQNIERNALSSRVDAIHGDLRFVPLDGETFDLVTGSPPYFDVKAGIVPADSQKAHARFELRGDIRDYCAKARAQMARGSIFVFCFPTAQATRAREACKAFDLTIVRYRDVIPRKGRAPLFSLYCTCRAEDAESPPIEEPLYYVRDEAGSETTEHSQTRASFGLI